MNVHASLLVFWYYLQLVFHRCCFILCYCTMVGQVVLVRTVQAFTTHISSATRSRAMLEFQCSPHNLTINKMRQTRCTMNNFSEVKTIT